MSLMFDRRRPEAWDRVCIDGLLLTACRTTGTSSSGSA